MDKMREAIAAAIDLIQRGHYTLAMKELQHVLQSQQVEQEPMACVMLDPKDPDWKIAALHTKGTELPVGTQLYAEPVDAECGELARRLHYPDCWDTAAYPTLNSALLEVAGCSAHPPKPVVPGRMTSRMAREWLSEHTEHVTEEKVAALVMGWNAYRNAILSAAPSLPEPQPAIITCIGKGGRYEFLGESIPAGKSRNDPSLMVYRDVESGKVFTRYYDDFAERMQLVEGTLHESMPSSWLQRPSAPGVE